ncbi:MAG: tRNA lysidine(34) synthetase TilS [Sphingomonadaceae bacterium]|nr:tRNA lysidine(34) synthetase TilS [Sphingomonadaceae bacterium]
MPSAAADAVTGIDPADVARFAARLAELGCHHDDALAVAVSGGGDSVALLLLAIAARPGRVSAATVDHGLRAEAAAEAQSVAALCARLGAPHTILTVDVARVRGGLQASARAARYDALARWCPAPWLLVGHQRDDVAESLLMRLSRGSGVGGLARMHDLWDMGPDRPALVRPLLGWSRAELLAICVAAGVQPIDDPSNRDPRFDRAHARRLLARTPWLSAERLARAADNLADADIALAWLADREWAARVEEQTHLASLTIDAEGLPHETRRRFIERALRRLGARPPLDKIETLLDLLEDGHAATLAGIKATPGPPWRFTPAPPRRQNRTGD